MSSSVSLSDFAHAFQAIIPGAELRTDSLGRLTATWYVRVHHDLVRATGPDQAAALLRELAEQMRHRAIRELGLEPILEGMRAEVRAFKTANAQLQATCDARAKRIVVLEELLAGDNDE